MKSLSALPLVFALLISTPVVGQEYLGQWSGNQFSPNSTSNPYGAGSPYGNTITNQFGNYGSPYSNQSVNNPFATNAPKLYDNQGNYRGKLSSNPFDSDSISNPYGKYGNPFSSDSVNNPFGAGNPFSPSIPTNPYGTGFSIYGQ